MQTAVVMIFLRKHFRETEWIMIFLVPNTTHALSVSLHLISWLGSFGSETELYTSVVDCTGTMVWNKGYQAYKVWTCPRMSDYDVTTFHKELPTISVEQQYPSSHVHCTRLPNQHRSFWILPRQFNPRDSGLVDQQQPLFQGLWTFINQY